MEQQRRYRDVCRDSFMRATDKLRVLLTKTPIDSVALKVAVEMLRLKHSTLQKADDEITTLLMGEAADRDVLGAEQATCAEFMEQFLELQQQVSDLTSKPSTAAVPSSGIGNNGVNLYNIQDSLKSRYGREDLLIEVYVRELLKLIIQNATSTREIDLVSLYDKLETQLRALETLGVTTEKAANASIANLSDAIQREEIKPARRLANLMAFLKREVEGEERIALAAEGFGISSGGKASVRKQSGNDSYCRLSPTFKKKVISQNAEPIATAAGLVVQDGLSCVFCDKNHESTMCVKAQNFSLEQRKDIVKKKGACFRCLRGGHSVKRCRATVKCIICKKEHVPLMCSTLTDPQVGSKPEANNAHDKSKAANLSEKAKSEDLANFTSSHVFLQTFRVNIRHNGGERDLRVLIDYILKSTSDALGLEVKRRAAIAHGLFGGTTVEHNHSCYDVTLVKGDYSRTVEVLDQPTICHPIPPVFYGPWIKELKRIGISLSDVKDSSPIEILLGADVAGHIYTGKREVLECGMVAVETVFGWTLMGKIDSQRFKSNMEISCLVSD
ncbi:uncharacterized protein LOC116164034 [Photinus pyralis]|uniref:uncharacterized protein LOC116164034 n=1 Tax=Photinus pyralis TaxID=7054 RepID=UPI001266E906|nr:uncharacterized protein LOC116164034 [Photinus pyralis]